MEREKEAQEALLKMFVTQVMDVHCRKLQKYR